MIVNRDDARVPQPRHGSHFRSEGFVEAGIAGLLWSDDLDGNGQIQVHVGTAPDPAHATACEHATQLKGPELDCLPHDPPESYPRLQPLGSESARPLLLSIYLETRIVHSEESLEASDSSSHLIFRLGDVFSYLMKPSVWMVMVGLAVIVATLNFISFGVLSVISLGIAAGLEITVFFQVLRSSAQNEKELNAPDFLSIFDSIIKPILLILTAATPMIAAMLWATGEILSGAVPNGAWAIGPLVLFIVGLLLYPLLVTIAAIDQSPSRVLNPLVWFDSLMRLGTSYIVAAAGFYFFWFIELLLAGTIVAKIQSDGFFGTGVIALLLLYIPRTLRYRMLGALCEPILGQPIQAVHVLPLNEFPEKEIDDTEERLAELNSGNLNSRSILRMANTAYNKKRMQLVYRAVEYLWKNHPDSPEVVQALWVAGQAQESEGNTAALKSTLETLVAHHPNHPMATDARSKLRRLS